MSVKVEGIDNVLSRLKRLRSILDGTLKSAMFEAGGYLLAQSNKEVPLDKGTLSNSGKVEQITDAEVEVGYHTPYALRLHEHPEFNFQNNRKGKYLEDPLKANLSHIGDIIAGKLSKEIK